MKVLKEIAKMLFIFSVICLLWLLCVIATNYIIDNCDRSEQLRMEDPDGPEMQKLKKLMKKHGVNVMYEGWDGRHWFKRDGKKVYIKYKG